MKTFSMAKPITGRHMLIVFVVFFGVVFAVNMFMATVAVRSWTGMVVENSYVASQHFNSDVADLKKSAELGISHRLHIERGRLLLSLEGADGKPLEADDVQIQFERPFGATSEQNLVATRIAPGQYEATASLSAGIWNGQLSALLERGNVWRQPFRLIAKGE